MCVQEALFLCLFGLFSLEGIFRNVIRWKRLVSIMIDDRLIDQSMIFFLFFMSRNLWDLIDLVCTGYQRLFLGWSWLKYKLLIHLHQVLRSGMRGVIPQFSRLCVISLHRALFVMLSVVMCHFHGNQIHFRLRLKEGHIPCYKISVCRAYLEIIWTVFRVQYSFKK